MYTISDFSKVQIDTIVIECDGSDMKKDSRVVDLLISKGTI